MTSTGEERMLAVSLALLVELPVAAVVAVVGVRFGRQPTPGAAG